MDQFIAGQEAFERRIAREDCPHIGFSEDRLAWLEGWEDAKHHAEIESESRRE